MAVWPSQRRCACIVLDSIDAHARYCSKVGIRSQCHHLRRFISSLVVAHDGGVKQSHITATLGRHSWQLKEAEGHCAPLMVLVYLLAREGVRIACRLEPIPGMLAPQSVLLKVLQVAPGLLTLGCSYARRPCPRLLSEGLRCLGHRDIYHAMLQVISFTRRRHDDKGSLTIPASFF